MYLSVNNQPKIYNTQFKGTVHKEVEGTIYDLTKNAMKEFIENANTAGIKAEGRELEIIKSTGKNIVLALKRLMNAFDDKIVLRDLNLKINKGDVYTNISIEPEFSNQLTKDCVTVDKPIAELTDEDPIKKLLSMVLSLNNNTTPKKNYFIKPENINLKFVTLIQSLTKELAQEGGNMQSFNKYINAYKYFAKLTGKTGEEINKFASDTNTHRENTINNNKLLREYTKGLWTSEK